MPNSSFNTIAFQGTKEAMHKFIKIGLENSNLASTDDLHKDFDLLFKEGKTKSMKDGKIVLMNDVTARTFLPMPDTYLLYDTTNKPNAFPMEVIKEQSEKYGAIGWYGYNCRTLGMKWNFHLNEDGRELELTEPKKGIFRFEFYCETAYCIPDMWLINIKKLVPELGVFICATEEFNAYLFCGYVDNGTIVEYANYTEEFYNMCDDFEAKREEIQSNPAKMEELKKIATDNCKAEGVDATESTINTRIDDIIYGEVCAFFGDMNIYDKLSESFAEMIDCFLEKEN